MVNLISVILQKDGIKRGNARTQWEEEEKEMKRLFQKGAELSYLEGLIDGDTKQKYFMSGTLQPRNYKFSNLFQWNT